MFHKSEPQLQQNFQEEAKDLGRLNPGIKEGENVFSPNKTCEHRALNRDQAKRLKVSVFIFKVQEVSFYIYGLGNLIFCPDTSEL